MIQGSGHGTLKRKPTDPTVVDTTELLFINYNLSYHCCSLDTAGSTTTTAPSTIPVSTTVAPTTTTITTTTAPPSPGEVNYACTEDDDCTTLQSDCRNNAVCECKAGYSYNPPNKTCDEGRVIQLK